MTGESGIGTQEIRTLTFRERELFHQIHPAKLVVDWGMGILALALLWQHQLVAALLLAFVPSFLVSLLVLRYADLDRLGASRFGKYVARSMTRTVEGLRLAGYGIMAAGAWLHIVWAIALGLIVIVLAWLRGVLLPAK